MKRVRISVFTVLMVLLSVAMGFASGEQESATGEGETITIWVGGQVAELDRTWETVVGRYEEMSGNTVEVQLFGFDTYYDRLLTSLVGEAGPDLAFADLGGWVPTFASEGWLLSMEDMIAAW